MSNSMTSGVRRLVDAHTDGAEIFRGQVELIRARKAIFYTRFGDYRSSIL